MKSRSSLKILALIILVGALLRFYGLYWGGGLFFHPDENNMARAISQLDLNKGLYPDFFAYGQFPLYLVYFSYQLVHGLQFGPVPFADAVYALRFWSALFSTFTIPVIYLITRKLLSTNYSLLAVTIVAFMPGLIQAAHFGTTESLLTFLFMLIIYFSMSLGSLRTTVLLGIILGLSLGVKISAVYFITPVVAASLCFVRDWRRFIYFWLVFTVFTLLAAVLASVYNLIDYPAYLSSMRYETSVALGDVKVFYTRQFENSLPFVFQLSKIFPFAVGFVSSVLGLLGMGFAIREYRRRFYQILIISFVVFITANSLIFAKWTRFMTPVFPLFAIFAVYMLMKMRSKIITRICLGIIILQGLLFFSIYIYPDTRVAASEWIYENIPSKSYALSETANVVDIPAHSPTSRWTALAGRPSPNYQIISFDFYHLDQERELPESLINHLEKADYIFIPSRRLFGNLPQNKGRYPILEKYYDALFSGELGFELVHTESPYSNPEGWSWSNVEEVWAEETFTVFDHPTIRIYKKITPGSSDYYRELLL